MEFIEGSRGIYRPIRVLFDTPVYEGALQTCWHMGSYTAQIALLTELLRLQQRKQLPSEVTVEDMTELLVEQSKLTLKERLWEFELNNFDEAEDRLLLKMVWAVNTSMKMRDIEFEARRLLSSPEDVPPQSQHPRIMVRAQRYARSLSEQHQEALSSKLLGPRAVLLEVVPRVLQGFWFPPLNTTFSMPSKQLSRMAVGVTKAVEDRLSTALSTMLRQVTFSRPIREHTVLSIQEKVRQGHTQGVLVKMLQCFAAEVLNTISDIAAAEICLLFQTHAKVKASYINMNTEEDCIQPADMLDPGLELDNGPIREHDVITSPPSPMNNSVGPQSIPTVQNDLNLCPTETEEQPTPSTESNSAVVPAYPALQIFPDEPLVTTAVQEDLTSSVEPSSNVSIHVGLNNNLDKVKEQPTSSQDPYSTVVTKRPSSLTHTGKPPIITAVQGELTITGQPVKVDEPFHTTQEFTKTEMRGFSCSFSSMQKNICCCFLPEGDAQKE